MSHNASSRQQAGFTILELMFSMAVFSIILLAASASIIQVSRMYLKGVITSKTQNLARQTIDNMSRAIQFSGQDFVMGAVPFELDASEGLYAHSVCIGDDRYTYVIGMQVDSDVAGGLSVDGRKIRHALWQDKLTSAEACPAADLRRADPSTYTYVDPANPAISISGNTSQSRRELLQENSRLTQFNIHSDTITFIHTINLGVVYGDTDLLECKNSSGVILATCDGMTADWSDIDWAKTACKGGFSLISAQFCAKSELSTAVIRRLR